ncbi:DUF1428 domain-containing protein [Notoacmeibacter ruber]|uniref:DUF1428 domain-containing protein n=1 Tax=Notoacmeibacter ruber TaxID=2670375 RepID=A0A3L7J9A8_9HYPH|nr:DUF1428 domain-containing protein [Notoacmeibacter ruber]RLQ86955.1 DUF1428 domain-containing protein [Notoacmeibacter ruber]
MTVVSGFVAAVPKANKDKFIAHAKAAAEVFKEHGALEIMENWELDVPDGESTSFPLAVKKNEDEDVVFSWIVWPDKNAADRAMEALMSDPRMDSETNPMPFDGKRMIWGFFDNIVKV